jgi:phage recombination protein Bet
MSTTPNSSLVKADKGETSFVPFGSKDEIKLSIPIVQNFVAVPTKSGATCTTRDAIKFIALCQAQRLNPFAGDAYLVGYDSQQKGPTFSLITAHVAFLKRAETCVDYEGMESGIVILKEDGTLEERETDFKLPEEKCVGGWARVYRKGRKPTYRKLAVASRKPKYETQFWDESHAPEQICKCAESDALRSTFPTLLGGLYTHGEMGEIIDISSGPASMPSDPKGLVATTSEPAPEKEQQSERADNPPAEKQEGRKGKGEPTLQDQVEAIVTEAGFTFQDWQKWAIEEFPAVQADSLADFGQLSTQHAKLFVRGKQGMIEGLTEMKKGAA